MELRQIWLVSIHKVLIGKYHCQFYAKFGRVINDVHSLNIKSQIERLSIANSSLEVSFIVSYCEKEMASVDVQESTFLEAGQKMH